MTVTLNSYDLCVQGFERLRKQSEFILCTPVDASMTRRDVFEALLADMNSCMREDDFDYDGCEAMLRENFLAPTDGTATKFPNDNALFDGSIEDRDEDEESCYLFLYCEEC